jgi:DNA-binding FadR family transcriptional regulator
VCDPEKLDDIMWMLVRLNRKADQIMSGLTDLQQQVANLQAAMTAEESEQTQFLADIAEALANEDSDAAVEAASQLVAAQVTALQAQTAALAAADPATPASTTPPAAG